MSTIIQNGTIVTATDTITGDIKIEGEQIQKIAPSIPPETGDRVIDATGKYIFPGGIDPHTHLDMPFMGTVSADNFPTGTEAALRGGTTTLIDFIIPTKGKSLHESLDLWHKKAEGAVSDYSFHMALVEHNDQILKEIPEIIKRGVPSFKCFMAYKGALQIDDFAMISFLKTLKEHNGLTMVHAENGDMIATETARLLAEGKTSPKYHYAAHPDLAEEEAVQRAIALVEFTNAPLMVVHLSSAKAMASIKDAQKRGLPVVTETCPQYLLLDNSKYDLPGFEGAKYAFSPPLRPANHPPKLWEGLQDGTIQFTATDHCPFNFKGQKEMGKDNFAKIPNGAAGVGDRFNLLFSYGVNTGKLSLNQFVNVTSTAAAKLYGLYPQKGEIAVGSDADLVIFDPKKEATISAETQFHNCDYSIFEGYPLTGVPETVLLRGNVVVDKGALNAIPGKFLPRTESGK